MNLKESQYIELKESWRDEYLKTIAALATTDGGTLLVGYNDEGEIIGVHNSKKLLEDLPNKIASALGITASVGLKQEEGKDFIEINIPKCTLPVSYQGKFYLRSGSTTQEIKGVELQNLILKAHNLTWDEIIVPDAVLDDIDKDAVQAFIRKATENNRLPSDLDTKDITLLFKNLRLTNDKGELTRAALLLFGKDPIKYFGSTKFKLGRFRGDDPTDLITQDLVEGNIFQMPNTVIDLLRSKYLLSPITYKGLQRVETLEIPEKALREAILNAIIHREYSSLASIELRVFDDKLIIWNPGDLPEPLNIEMLKELHSSYPRNSIIADIFYRAGYIESWGRGTLTIISETKKAGLPDVEFKKQSKGIELTFKRFPFIEQSDQSFNRRQLNALEYLKKNSWINNGQYQELNKCSKRTALRDLNELLETNIVEIKGSSTATEYHLLK